MKEEIDYKKELDAFIQKLKEKEHEYMGKIRFLHEHKFDKEKEFWETKQKVMVEIRQELQTVVQGHRKGIDATFYFH